MCEILEVGATNCTEGYENRNGFLSSEPDSCLRVRSQFRLGCSPTLASAKNHPLLPSVTIYMGNHTPKITPEQELFRL